MRQIEFVYHLIGYKEYIFCLIPAKYISAIT